jgi:DNA-binding Lrp family transcriptional regulator
MSEYDNTKDAYVFVKGVREEYIKKFLGLPDQHERIRYTAVLTGDWDGVAAVSFEELPELEEYIFTNFRGNPSSSTAIGLFPRPPFSLRWSPSFPHEAIVRIWVESGRAMEVWGSLQGLSGIMGATIVAGDFDILAGAGADEFDTLRSLLLNELQNVPGVTRTATAFVTHSKSNH